jgi:hypothetical protein
MLIAIVPIVSKESGIAPRLLATRADAEEVARTVDEHGPRGREVAGARDVAARGAGLGLGGPAQRPHRRDRRSGGHTRHAANPARVTRAPADES